MHSPLNSPVRRLALTGYSTHWLEAMSNICVEAVCDLQKRTYN